VHLNSKNAALKKANLMAVAHAVVICMDNYLVFSAFLHICALNSFLLDLLATTTLNAQQWSVSQGCA
jgi:hypothetical protein